MSRTTSRAPCASRSLPTRPPGSPRASGGGLRWPTGMGDRFTLSLRTYRWVAYPALATLVLIVFSGAGVRLTGSGLGCPSWPDCSGTFVPELDTHVWIEYGNRLFSTVVGIACVAAGVLAFRVRPPRRDLLKPATLLAAGVIAQGVLGGITVLLRLTWQVVIAHYLLSMALLVAGAVLVWRVRWLPARIPRQLTGSSCWARACSWSTARW